MLPLQLCDWAMAVIIVALWTGNRRWLEVAYFWGIGGTLQAIITPNLRYGFPTSVSSVSSSRILDHYRNRLPDVDLRIPPARNRHLRTFAWTEIYFVVAFTIDFADRRELRISAPQTGAASLLNFLSDSRPLYLLEFHGLAFFSSAPSTRHLRLSILGANCKLLQRHETFSRG